MYGGQSKTMSIKLALMKSGEYIISDAKEILNKKNNVCGYIFKNPHRVTLSKPTYLAEDSIDLDLENKMDVTLSPWIIITEDSDYPVSLESVITLVNPMPSLEKMYADKVLDNTLAEVD
tara:strand:- start:251 stop:607 length:357 start_codon:yes stop_codon:yes gene_type:complete